MSINITESDILFNKELNVCYDELIEQQNNFSNNLDIAINLLSKLLAITTMEIEKDISANGLFDVVNGYIYIVKENVITFKEFKNDIINSNINKETLNEENRLTLIRMLSNIEFLKFKLDEILKKMPDVILHNVSIENKRLLSNIKDEISIFKNSLK